MLAYLGTPLTTFFFFCDKVLEAVQDLCSDICPLVYSSYSAPSSLQWGESTILSQEGVQQGDPLGPLLFCLDLNQFFLLTRYESHKRTAMKGDTL